MNWQTIFELSKANGALYIGDALPYQNWKWPKNTWLQQRLLEVRKEEKQFELELIKRNVGMAFQEN